MRRFLNSCCCVSVCFRMWYVHMCLSAVGTSPWVCMSVCWPEMRQIPRQHRFMPTTRRKQRDHWGGWRRLAGGAFCGIMRQVLERTRSQTLARAHVHVHIHLHYLFFLSFFTIVYPGVICFACILFFSNVLLHNDKVAHIHTLKLPGATTVFYSWPQINQRNPETVSCVRASGCGILLTLCAEMSQWMLTNRPVGHLCDTQPCPLQHDSHTKRTWNVSSTLL